MNELTDITHLLRKMVELGGSDLHLSAGRSPSIRLHGEITPLATAPLNPIICRETILGILTDTQRAQLEKNLELDFGIGIKGIGRFRGNAHYSRSNLEAVFRHIPKNIPLLAELGHQPIVEELCKNDQGLILVTGMTGSGKTTTLASMLQKIADSRDAVIITIEDPIEFEFSSSRSIIKQRELGRDTLSFAHALKHVLRQDPDVIMLGEMRDDETVRAALTAAETGHLVLATLHTNDAPQALDRIVDFFPGDEQDQILGQLANVLTGVIAQRLVLGENRKKRVLLTEFLARNSAVSACIRERRFEQLVGLMEIGRKDGMNTFDDSLEYLYLNRQISKEDAIANARDPNRLINLRRQVEVIKGK
jgi:twitching motility protein PilT